jgi:chloride channel protein, CIC family
MGPTLGGAFGVLVDAVHPVQSFGTTTCAIIGMAVMVGGGTGAAMTAVTMIFEMTRDYDLVMPNIVAVALAIGVRRLLSQENIYTVKLVGLATSCRRRCTPTCSWCAAPTTSCNGM